MAYATIDEVEDRLDFEMDDATRRMAGAALDDASDMASDYKNWEDPGPVPGAVKRIVLRAVVRYIRNPDGYSQSRAGDELVAWHQRVGDRPGEVYFTDDEIKTLKRLSNSQDPAIYSVPLYAWMPGSSPLRRDQYAPTDTGPIPYIAKEEL